MTTSATLLLLTLAVLLATPPSPGPGPARSVPVTGMAVPALAPFDELMVRFLEEQDCPGATLCIARGGRVIYERGFGYADRETREPMASDAALRIASISKPLTATAVLQLVEAGRLSLDANPFVVAGYEAALGADGVDERLRRVTVAMLLQHTGGWDREKSFDPMFAYRRVTRATGATLPYDHDTLIRFMLGQPIDFDPGTRVAYSNFGYCVLGRVIERVTGTPYETHVRSAVLAPVGAGAMYVGRSMPDERGEGEVVYHARRAGTVKAARDRTRRVPRAYAHDHELLDAHGGWVGSARDLVRFGLAFDRTPADPLLDDGTRQLMIAPPPGAAGHEDDGRPKTVYLGMGWQVRRLAGAGRHNVWHTGSLPGTASLLVHLDGDVTWAVLFNRGREPEGDRRFGGLIDGELHRAAARVKEWP